MKKSEQPTTETVILFSVGMILLVCGLAPIGLFQVARSAGVDTSEFKAFPPAVAFLGMLLFIIFILGICSLFKSNLAIRVGLWSIIGIAVLNLGGCASMWNDFRGVAEHSEPKRGEQGADGDAEEAV